MEHQVSNLIWFVVSAPIVGAILNGFILPRNNKRLSHFVGVTAVAISFLLSLPLLWEVIQDRTSSFAYAYSWIKVGSLDIDFEFVLDQLSILMLLVITGIGTLIHIYAGGYMKDEKRTYRFFSYLNLFIFMMLLLVLGNNMVVMFVGWEGVGLCSYLLIGYWFENRANAQAGMKAFVVNRVGDFGFILGIFLTYKTFGTLSFSELKEVIIALPLSSNLITTLTMIGLCFFVGACGKSAQFPLHIWLPDAMAGPTPVSALIHAATMVTAGIYMMTRLHFIYYFSPTTMTIIAFVGAFTALFASSIALVQNDIKKVLAFSTVSQLGYMVLGVGVGAFEAGVFHLLTHACFKALLFLGAGSIIVAMHHKQDMLEMGGLSKFLPITHKVFLIGVLAIIGVPGLSGFFSKDEILWRAFVFPNGGMVLWTMGTLAAMCTAFYMVRLLCLTFYGENRSDKKTREHLHETSTIMWAPLTVLATLSIFIGYLGVPEIIGHAIGIENLFSNFLSKTIAIPNNAPPFWYFMKEHHSAALEWGLMSASTSLGMASALTAYVLYKDGPSQFLHNAKERFAKTHRLLCNKYFIDENYEQFLIAPLKEISEFLWKIVDIKIINGFINFVGHFLVFVGGFTSFQMSGNLQRYLMLFVLGLISLLCFVITL